MNAQPDEDPIEPKPGRRFLWGRERKMPAPQGKRERRSDILIALAGTGLGLGCAMFPWYVFFNQEQFGVRAMQFSRAGEMPPPTVTYQPPREMPPVDSAELPAALDLFATGTLPDAEKPAFLPPAAQPFPGDVKFQVVHIANGRAMIADGDGMWVVQTGSTLPDASRVAAIEQRDGQWVLVTNSDRVIRVAN